MTSIGHVVWVVMVVVDGSPKYLDLRLRNRLFCGKGCFYFLLSSFMKLSVMLQNCPAGCKRQNDMGTRKEAKRECGPTMSASKSQKLEITMATIVMVIALSADVNVMDWIVELNSPIIDACYFF